MTAVLQMVHMVCPLLDLANVYTETQFICMITLVELLYFSGARAAISVCVCKVPFIKES